MIYRFGAFSLDTDLFELRDGDASVTVEPQAFSLIAYLVENRDRVLTKDEIIEHIWEGRIVSDSALNTRIYAARRAVGDNGTDQAIIKTYPRRGFRFVAKVADEISDEAPPEPSRSNEELQLPDKPSIAVLPFENMSGEPEQEYFADGMTEDIITELSKISGLFVIARHSAFTFKGKTVTLRQVGRDLGVRYVLEGSVRKAGSRLRITAQLTDAESDHHLWAERYDRDFEDIFAVQEEVARQVTQALRVTLKPEESDRLARAPTENLEVYELYLRSRMAFWPPSRENIVNAQIAYGRIADVDPNFAGGFAGKSIAHSMSVIYKHSADQEEDTRAAMELAERAIDIDDALALSHSALAMAYTASGKLDDAVSAAQRAVAIQPGDGDSLMFLSAAASYADQFEVARKAAIKAHRIDPKFGPYLYALGRACFMLGRYEEANEAYEHGVSLTPPAPPLLISWIVSLVQLGREEEARKKGRVLLLYRPDFSISRVLDVYPFGEHILPFITEGLRKAGLPE